MLLVVQVGSVAVVASVATPRLTGRDRLAGALTWVLLVLAQATAVPIVLGMVGLLRLPAVVVTHVALAALAVAFHRRQPTPDGGPPVPARGLSLLDLAAVGATTVYLALGTRLSLHPQRSFEFDTKEYHLANLASWLQAGHIWGLPYAQPGSMTANHPSSGEVFGLWLVLPSHGDELLYLAPIAFGLLAILAGALLGRELVAQRWGAGLGALAAAAVVTAPIYFSQVDSLLTDLIAGVSVVTAVAYLALAHRTESPPAPLVALAGIALGLGMGSKYTALLPGLVVGVVAIALLRRSRTWWWLVPGVVVLAAPWYLRNIITTGNPLFPQPIGPIDGAGSPYDVLDTSMLDQLGGGETEILRRTAVLARDFVGPLLALVALGVVLSLIRLVRDRRRRGAVSLAGWMGLLAVASLGIYLATPYTGGGPTGLDFIIVSCFRYALVGVLLAAVAGVVLAGRWVGGAAVTVTLGWNLWQIARDAGDERPQLEVGPATFFGAVALAAIVVAALQLAAARPEVVRRAPVTALGVLMVAGSLATAFVAYHRLDRGRTPTTLEATLLALGEDRPAVVIGVADLRAVLGPRLKRPLVKVSRGGAAEEIPFADEDQLRRRILGDDDTDPPPPELAAQLDRAIDDAGPDVLVTGGISPVGYPDGWRPAEGWCLAGGDEQGTVFVRPALLPPGVDCVRAPDLGS